MTVAGGLEALYAPAHATAHREPEGLRLRNRGQVAYAIGGLAAMASAIARFFSCSSPASRSSDSASI
ncbi:MAG: hypothetical protein AMXMBFR61_17200 [Fimbriimonadales bacterium]